MNLPSWALSVGTIVLSGLMFLVGLFVLMPRASLGYIAEAQIERATMFQYDATVQSAALSGISGVKASNLALKSRVPLPNNQPAGTVTIRKFRVNAGLLSVLRRQPAIRSRIDFPTGHARVMYRHGTASRDIELQFFDVALADIGILRDKLRMPIQGALRGTIEAHINADKVVESGEIDINLLALNLGPRTITGPDLPADVQRFFSGEIVLPALHAGDILLRGSIEEGVFTIDEFAGQGEDLRLGGDGRVVLRPQTSASDLALNLSVAIDPQWVDDAKIGSLISGVPMITEAQQGDNLVFAVSGTLGKPRFSAAGTRRIGR